MILETDMTSALQGDAKSGQGLLDRAKLFIANRDNQGLAMVNKGDEILTMLNVPLSGLDKLQAQAQEHMAAPAHMPLVKLTGITPAGLNADSEGEIQVWYDYVRAEQQSFYGPHLNTILQIIQLHLFGKIDDSIGFEFVPLSSPTVKELSEIRKANAETDNTYVSMGAVSPDEVRAKLRTDPESGYDNLEGEAPTPPDQLQIEGELEGASPTEAVQS
jgi:phage-related protein (TIGR01555 family)